MTSIGRPLRERTVQPDVLVVPPMKKPAAAPKEAPAPLREKEKVAV